MIRQSFRQPTAAPGARLPSHTWRLSDPKMYVSAQQMYGAPAQIGQQIAASLRGVGNNIRDDRIRQEQQERADRLRAEQQARADAIRAEQNARQDARWARQDERQAAADERANQRFEWDKQRFDQQTKDRAEDRQLRRESMDIRNNAAKAQLEERQVRLGIVQADRQMKLASAFRQRAASAKNPNEWNQLIDYYKGLGFTQAEAYRDYATGRERAVREMDGTIEGLNRRRIQLNNLLNESKLKVKGDGANERAAGNIASGLSNLARIPKESGEWSFESSVGPLQGDQDALLGPLARAAGSVMNMFGNQNTTEIRARVEGDVEALAAAIKPLIRKPGEGPWTDSDQRRLVAVVGNLTQARTVEEYRRGLENVRQRVMANFGIPIPPIPGITPGSQPQQTGQSSGGAQVPSGVKITVREN